MNATRSYDLSGKTALVTGASRGIGAAIAVALAEAGADIVAVSSNAGAPGGAVEAAVRGHGRRFLPLAADLSDRAQTHALVKRVLAEAPPIDILVNNAGIIRRAEAERYSDEDWDEVIEVNLSAAFVLAREFGKGMIARGGGKIVFLASVLSFQGGVFVPGYAASKGAIAQVTRSLACEWARHGVNVNAVAPGYTATDNTAALQADPGRAKAILDRVPAGRWGTPEDIAGPVVFLASEAARFIHGAILPVDGGWLAR